MKEGKAMKKNVRKLRMKTDRQIITHFAIGLVSKKIM